MTSTNSPADVLTRQRRALLLRQLADATNGELPLKKAASAPKWAKEQLDLTPEAATAVLDSLIAEQLVAGSEKGRTKRVAITQAGREAVERLAEFVPQPPPKKEKKAKPTLAEAVRAKVSALGEAPVPASKLGKPGGKNPKPEAVAAFEHTVKELIAEGKLFEHPGGKYGTRPVLTLAEVVRGEVQAKLDTDEGPFTRATLSKPKKNASADEKQAHDAALDAVIADLTADKKLFPHSGGKYGQLREVTLADRVREDVIAKLTDLHGTFKAADLSHPHADAKKKEKTAHAQALEQVVAELVEAKTLFRHPGGRMAKEPYVDPDRELREVYVLHQFFRATDHTITKADIELAFPGKGKPKLKVLETKYPHVARFRGQGYFEMGAPATRQTLEQLIASGDLRANENGEAYTLTAAGGERLTRARTAYPVLPPVGVSATPDDAAMRETWEGFVLLRLTEAAGFTAGEGVVFAGGYPKGSKLNEATAWVLYGELANAGHVTARWNGTEGEYTLTPKGLRYLAGLSFDGLDKLTIPGKTLTALLAAARTGEKTATVPASTHTSPPPADLEAAVMGIFHRLLRERHTNDSRVPIHEVRAEVARLYGPSAATHGSLDPVLNQLDLAGRVRLVEIDDRNRATPDQLDNSIRVSSGTLFFIKRIDDAR